MGSGKEEQTEQAVAAVAVGAKSEVAPAAVAQAQVEPRSPAGLDEVEGAVAGDTEEK